MEPFDPYGEKTDYGSLKRKATLLKSLSRLAAIKAFDDNVSIIADQTYSQVLSKPNSFGSISEQVTLTISRSLILLPENPLQLRLADPRVGYFYSRYQDMSTKENRSRTVYYIHHWDIQPRNLSAWLKGELTEPAKPIVFYIDNDFPASWKDAIREGLLTWNKAFEAIGFKNTIQVRPFPVNDPEFDPDNLKYNCVRYAPSGVENAMGPSWVDPRSGEIINSSIFIYHNIIKLANEMRFVQTAQIDPRVRTPKLPEDIFHETLRYIVSHEAGHCLGLMHNMAASAAIPVESLRSVTYTQQYGTTPSIMDYARFNYVAQPEDKGVKLTPPDLGVYDYFAIKVGYQPVPDAQTPEEVLQTVRQWIAEKAGDPMYRYGKEQVYDEYDPSAMMEDLGDDAVLAGNYGIKNLQYILRNMNQWLDSQDHTYDYRMNLYKEIVNQYIRYLTYAYRNIGGFHLFEHFVGDPLPATKPVSKEMQQRSTAFLIDQLRHAEWIDAPEVVSHLTVGTAKSERIVKMFAPLLVNTKRVSLASYRDPQGYTPEEYLDDVYRGVWASTLQGKDLSKNERLLQYEVVCELLRKLQLPSRYAQKRNRRPVIETLAQEVERQSLPYEPTAGVDFQNYVTNISNDNQAHLYHGLMIRIQKLMESRQNTGSFETRMHYGFLLEKIEDIRNW